MEFVFVQYIFIDYEHQYIIRLLNVLKFILPGKKFIAIFAIVNGTNKEAYKEHEEVYLEQRRRLVLYVCNKHKLTEKSSLKREDFFIELSEREFRRVIMIWIKND